MNIHAAVHAAKNATKYDGRVYDESVAHPLTVEEFNAMVACLLSGPLMECLIRKKWHPALESIIAHVLSDLQVSSTIIVSTQNVQLSESYLGTIIASDLGTLADSAEAHIFPNATPKIMPHVAKVNRLVQVLRAVSELSLIHI